MQTLLQKLNFKWDTIRGRFNFFVVKEKEDFEGCVKVLEEVRRKELNRVAGQSVLDSHSFSGKKIPYQLVATRDSKTNQIVGCLRLTNAFDAKDIPSSNHEYHLDLFPDELLKKLTIFTRLAVLKPYRKTPAALTLMSGGLTNVIENGGQAVLLSCEPNLFSMYKRLGMHPIGSPHNAQSGGFRIPMIYIPDWNYMKKIKSPALSFVRKLDFSKSEPIRRWYNHRKLEFMKFQFEETQYHHNQEGEPLDHFITAGLSKKGRADFLKNSISIKCKKEDIIISKNDGGKAIGVVKKGKVKVDVGGVTIVELQEGDVFGEIAFVLNTTRTATLKAAEENTEVILFSVSAVRRLEKDTDKIIVWQNIAKILAQRLVQRTTI